MFERTPKIKGNGFESYEKVIPLPSMIFFLSRRKWVLKNLILFDETLIHQWSGCTSSRGYEILKDELKVAESEITQICKL
jgi:hypothetical protein